MAILPESSVKQIEDTSHVAPPPGSVPTTSVLITCFDRIFLFRPQYSWMRRIYFYESKHPTLYFMKNIIPNLKTSLSLTLKHFFPFAGNLVLPPPPKMPFTFYTEGDSISFSVKESMADFNRLAGDHAADRQELQALVPQKPPAIADDTNGCMQEPVMAIQITVFPNAGISIGVGCSHVAVDARSCAHFMKSWASVYRCQGDLTCLDNDLPSFNRDLLNNPPELASLFTEAVERPFQTQDSISPDVCFKNFRITYTINRCQIELLKAWVKRKYMDVNGSEPTRMSTFVVTYAYLWVCLNKLWQIGTHQQHPLSADSNALSYFHFAAECRELLKLPATYFGNCIISHLAAAKKIELVGENGILVAATAIAKEIMEFQKQPFKDAEESLRKIIENFDMGKDILFAASSAKIGYYKADFGWGRPRKTSLASLGSSGTRCIVCVAENKDEEEGGVEFDLAFASHELDNFNAIFNQGLLKLQ